MKHNKSKVDNKINATTRVIIGRKDNKIFEDYLAEINKYIEGRTSPDKLIAKYEEWEKYISSQSKDFCFYSSVFEYIVLILMAIVYYKNKITEEYELEITILTTQLPKSLVHDGDDAYNPYFMTSKALKLYFDTFQKLIADEIKNKKITVNRHFLYTDDEKRRLFNKRITLVYPLMAFRSCYCRKDKRGYPLCKAGDCSRKRPATRCGGRNWRKKFLYGKRPAGGGYANHYLFSLSNLLPNDNMKNHEIREFVGFQVRKVGHPSDKDNTRGYKKCYISNLTDSMTSMFIKIWNEDDLTRDGEYFRFMGEECCSFGEFVDLLKANQQTENSLSYIWGVPDVKTDEQPNETSTAGEAPIDRQNSAGQKLNDDREGGKRKQRY